MKKILLIASLVGLIALPVMAQTPVYGPQTINNPTNWIIAGGMTNFSSVIDCSKSRNVAFQLTYAGDAVGGAGEGIVMHYKYSVDGITYASATTPIVFPVIGVTNRTVTTNLDTVGFGYMKIGVSNAAGTANITNLAMSYSYKISTP